MGRTHATPSMRTRRALLALLAGLLGAAALVALAASMQFDGYVLNILLQATTFSIAVFGLSVVLGLCGQINLAQAAFFGFGAYVVGLGTADLHLNFWLCLVGGCAISLVAGAFLGMSTLRLGGHYLAMVTISFQQIVTLVMINAIGVTHGPDGVANIRRPELFQSSQSYLAFCVAMLAIVGFAIQEFLTKVPVVEETPQFFVPPEGVEQAFFPHVGENFFLRKDVEAEFYLFELVGEILKGFLPTVPH